jgi:uncharacterized protein (TIGR02271 family)
MNRNSQLHITDKNGVRGTIDVSAGPPFDGDGAQVLVRLEDGQAVVVPTGALVPRKEDGYFLPSSLIELERFDPDDMTIPEKTQPRRELLVMPIIEEELSVERHEVETGRVRIRKVVREREEVVDEPLLQEEAVIRRVTINQIVDSPVPVRYEGDTMIVPLLEEVLVTEKRLLLKEELHVSVRRFEGRNPQTVTLRSEDAIIERFDSQGAQQNGEAQPE